MGPAGACQGECKILDALGQAQVAESRVYDETRGGNVGFVAPGLYVAEPGKPVAREGYYGLGLFYLSGQVLVGTLGDTGAPYLGGIGDSFEYGVYVFLMRSVGHHDLDFFHCFFFVCFISGWELS